MLLAWSIPSKTYRFQTLGTIGKLRSPGGTVHPAPAGVAVWRTCMQPWSQLPALTGLTLGDQLTVDRREQLALSLAELGVGLQRVQDVHGGLVGRHGDGQVAQ